MSARCEVCEGPVEKTCGYDNQPMLGFCTEHYIEHLEDAHAGNLAARREAAALRIELRKSERELTRLLKRPKEQK